MPFRTLIARLEPVTGIALAILIILGPPSSQRTVSVQVPALDRMAVVVSDEPWHLQVWRAGPGGYQQAWEAVPRVADPSWDERRSEQLASPYDAGMKIADLDGDGSNELVVADPYGITVYGRTPAYYSFPIANSTSLTTSLTSFTIADVDGEGGSEIITLRMARDSESEQSEIEVLKAGTRALTSVWKGHLPGLSAAICAGDVDNDGEREIICGTITPTILKRRPGPKWEAVAELPLTPPTGGWIGGDRWIQVADADGDGKNEILAGGTDGKLTIFKSAKLFGRMVYPVLWQSANLVPEGMTARPNDRRGPSCLVTSLAVADVDGDGRAEVVAGTADYGRIGQVDISGGRLHVFRYNGRGDFTRVWLSDWIAPSAVVSGIADLDGDGVNEVLVGGRHVYKAESATHALRPVASLLPTATAAVIGPLPDLREPSAVRIVPLYWILPGGQVQEGETLDVPVTLRSVWSDAKDITVTVLSEDPVVEVNDASFRIPSIPANGMVTTPTFKLTGRQSGRSARLRIDVTAAGGYRQSVTSNLVHVVSAPPTYVGNVESRVANALARARDDNRRILIQWGSNADPAAAALISITRRDSDVAKTLVYEYEVVRADVKGAERVAAKYKGRGAAPTPPYFTVLDAQGRVLATQAAAAFRQTGDAASAYDTKKLNAFLAGFKPTYLKAEPLLSEALSQAKKDQKTLFLYFSAPT